jgi:MFS family permease
MPSSIANADCSQALQQRLDQSPMTRPMVWLWVLSASLIALDGFDFFIIGVALPFVQRDFALGPAAVGAVAAAALVGSLAGSLTLGPLTDRIGRQPMLVADVLLFVVASAGTALAWNLPSLLVFRLLVGVAIGADYPISVAYIVENMPARYRDRLVIGAFSFQAVGALLGALTGLGVIAAFGSLSPGNDLPAIHYAWRAMLAVGVGLAGAVALLRLAFSFESPAYLLARGDAAAASAAATVLLGVPIALSLEESGDDGNAGAQPPLSYRDLFAPAYRRRTILASAPWFLQDIATYGVGIFTPVILGTLTFATEPGLLGQTRTAAQGAAVVDIFLIAGFGLAIALVRPLGPIALQGIGFVGMSLGLGLLATSAHFPPDSSLTLGLVFGGFGLFNLLMNAGPNATTFLLSGEVFPAAIRASGAGLAGAIAKAGAVLGTFGLPVVQQAIGLGPTLGGLAGLCLGAALITWLYRVNPGVVPEGSPRQ